MSRVYEALKKAEQEGATDQAAQNDATVRQYGPAPALAAADPSVQVPLPAISNISATESGVLLSHELLVQRGRQTEWKPNSSLLFQNGHNDETAKEVFRTLRTRLFHIRAAQGLRTLLVTSALPREGKSFVVSNLAHSIVRQREQRVLLIDGDLRVCGLHRFLGALPSPGLSDYLLGEVDELAAIQRGQDENLFFIPSGKCVGNPTELLGNGRLEQLLSRVSPAFDWILFDSPPAIPVSDAAILAKHCDGVLMVVRANSTPFDLAQKACQEFRDKSVIGAVLNRSDQPIGYGNYAYARTAELEKERAS